jgi:hypothetical protein
MAALGIWEKSHDRCLHHEGDRCGGCCGIREFFVRIYDEGELVSEIIAELWMLNKYGHHYTGRISEKTDHELTVLSKT